MPTLADFRLTASSVLGLDNTDGSDEQALMDKYANDAVIQVLRRTRLRVLIADLPLTAGAKDYELPSGIMFITAIIDANHLPLSHLQPDEIYDQRIAQATSGGISPYSYAVNGANMLMIYPTPAAADVLTFYYVPFPDPMTLPTDNPAAAGFGGIQEEYHTAIESYMLWKLADYGDDATSQQGDRYQRDFRTEIAEIRAAMRRRGKGGLTPFRMQFPLVITSPSQGPRFV